MNYSLKDIADDYPELVDTFEKFYYTKIGMTSESWEIFPITDENCVDALRGTYLSVYDFFVQICKYDCEYSPLYNHLVSRFSPKLSRAIATLMLYKIFKFIDVPQAPDEWFK